MATVKRIGLLYLVHVLCSFDSTHQICRRNAQHVYHCTYLAASELVLPAACLGASPAGQQPPEQRQAALAAAERWLAASQPLLAAALTSKSQEQAIAAALEAAASGDPSSMELVEQPEEGEAAAAADGQAVAGPAVQQLKHDMLRVEALLADTMQVSRAGQGRAQG